MKMWFNQPKGNKKRSLSRAKASIFKAVDWKILKLRCTSYFLSVT